MVEIYEAIKMLKINWPNTRPSVRQAGGPTAPAAGLYLTDVLYKDN